MQITLTPGEAQALADVMDEKVRTGGLEAAALYGPIARQMIEAAKAKTQEQQEKETPDGEDHGHD